MRSSYDQRILVVDDEPVIRLTLASLLESEGYTVMTAATPQEALECLAQKPIDLLLSDVMLLDGASGLAVAQQARVMQPGIAILLLTGWMTLTDLPSSHLMHQFETLCKTVSPDELLVRVAELLTVSHVQEVVIGKNQ